jgi:zinc and cadmium transporter
VADLLPQLQRRLHLRDTLSQIGWIAAGLASVVMIGGISRH